MARQCMRPGCDRPVAAQLTVDPSALAVWIDRAGDGGGMAQQVCVEHAATLTAPLGWSITDRRLHEPLPTSQPADLSDESAACAPDLAPEPVADPVAEPAAEVDPEEPEPARRRQGLLDRAFTWTGPQRSILTQETYRGEPLPED